MQEQCFSAEKCANMLDLFLLMLRTCGTQFSPGANNGQGNIKSAALFFLPPLGSTRGAAVRTRLVFDLLVLYDHPLTARLTVRRGELGYPYDPG